MVLIDFPDWYLPYSQCIQDMGNSPIVLRTSPIWAPLWLTLMLSQKPLSYVYLGCIFAWNIPVYCSVMCYNFKACIYDCSEHWCRVGGKHECLMSLASKHSSLIAVGSNPTGNAVSFQARKLPGWFAVGPSLIYCSKGYPGSSYASNSRRVLRYCSKG